MGEERGWRGGGREEERPGEERLGVANESSRLDLSLESAWINYAALKSLDTCLVRLPEIRPAICIFLEDRCNEEPR